MKNHIITIILLLLAAVAFILGLFVDSIYERMCDIVAFVLPTFAALVEIIISERSGKSMLDEINKRAIWVNLTEEEYEKLKSEGKLDDSTYYATYEDKEGS